MSFNTVAKQRIDACTVGADLHNWCDAVHHHTGCIQYEEVYLFTCTKRRNTLRMPGLSLRRLVILGLGPLWTVTRS